MTCLPLSTNLEEVLSKILQILSIFSVRHILPVKQMGDLALSTASISLVLQGENFCKIGQENPVSQWCDYSYDNKYL